MSAPPKGGSPAPGQAFSAPADAPPPYSHGLPQQPAGGGPLMAGQPMMMMQPLIMQTPLGVMFSRAPTVMQCPSCYQQIVTQLSYESGCCAWLGAGACCVFGCWLGCCLLPLCMPDLQDVVHTCPSCHQYIGTYQRL